MDILYIKLTQGKINMSKTGVQRCEQDRLLDILSGLYIDCLKWKLHSNSSSYEGWC